MNKEPTESLGTVEEMHSEADKRVGEVFRTMIIFTIIMVLGPILTYFYSRSYFESKYLNVFSFRYSLNQEAFLI